MILYQIIFLKEKIIGKYNNYFFQKDFNGKVRGKKLRILRTKKKIVDYENTI